MREWQTYAGATLWMIVATSMVSAALQPVELASAASPGIEMVSLCADGSSRVAMGCESIHL